MRSIDFLAVGDIVTDAFIKLKDASVNCDINREHCQLCVRFGEKVPYESVTIVRAVGNSPNAAVAARRLGMRSAIVTDIGDDENGQACVGVLRKEGVMTDFVKTHPNFESNYHYVLQYEEERTILVKHQAYPYKFKPPEAPPKWMYLSSLAENSLSYHIEISDYLAKNPQIKLAFQPGTFQIKLGPEKLASLYKRSEVFFCNKEEAEKILHSPSTPVKRLLAGIRALGPEIAVITDGPRGAYASNGKNDWFIPMYPDPKPPVSRTGAGDSFSSAFTVALLLGKRIPEALSWGPVNSMSVVQHIGAQAGLLKRDELELLLSNAPEGYQVQNL